ncbi:MAG: hypothetical protein R2939_12905 [Kofleriaceae bacterium]
MKHRAVASSLASIGFVIACGPAPAPSSPTTPSAAAPEPRDDDEPVSPAAAPAEDEPAPALAWPRSGLVGEIAAIPEPRSQGWEARVTELLRLHFDADHSEWIDTDAEVDAIGCPVLTAINDALRRTDDDLAYNYGVHDDYAWLADRLGFDEAIRAHLYATLDRCELTNEAYE